MPNPKSQSVFNDIFIEDHSKPIICLDSENKSECKTCNVTPPELPPQKPCPAPPVPSEIPGDYVQDPDYVHTDNNFTDEDKEKLEGIEDGAEVNVQADWTETDINSDAYIKNKPEIPLVYDGRLDLFLNGENIGNFTANSQNNVEVNIEVITKDNIDDIRPLQNVSSFTASSWQDASGRHTGQKYISINYEREKFGDCPDIYVIDSGGNECVLEKTYDIPNQMIYIYINSGIFSGTCYIR